MWRASNKRQLKGQTIAAKEKGAGTEKVIAFPFIWLRQKRCFNSLNFID